LYTAENIESELEVAAAGFCESHEGGVWVNKEEKTVTMSKILSWYSGDFGSNNREVATAVVGWLRSGPREVLQGWLDEGGGSGALPFKIKYFKYDWSTNALEGRYLVFHGAKEGGNCVIA
jgi:hypothetical protein